MSKILFILKRKEDYNIDRDSKSVGLSTGLYNSANYMNEMLNSVGISSEIVVVTDNNDIDREVTKHRPKYVIIEALWVVPDKFEILSKLHPEVTWIIRIHSEMPFMAGEGSAFKWIGEYSKYKNVVLGINAPRMRREILGYLALVHKWDHHTAHKKVVYLPNYYPIDFVTHHTTKKIPGVVKIGCFGAIRPLKNQLAQAIAAIEFANSIGKKLHFHINSNRIEMQGLPVLNNIISLFSHVQSSGHELINHEWAPRDEFLKICADMEIGMQVSFSETFNIVGADLVSQGVPLVGCSEIPWEVQGQANPTDTASMVYELSIAYENPHRNVMSNQLNLKEYSNTSRHIWKEYFE